jgi:hypothetical protein
MRPLVVQDFTPKLKLLLAIPFGNTPSNDIDQQAVTLDVVSDISTTNKPCLIPVNSHPSEPGVSVRFVMQQTLSNKPGEKSSYNSTSATPNIMCRC